MRDDPDKEIEATTEQPVEADSRIEKEDYSVFTVPQKRAIILSGSFISWFSPVSQTVVVFL